MQVDIQQPEQKQLLDILAANMRGQKYTLPILDYKRLLKESNAQAVFLQVFDTVPQTHLPEDPKRVHNLLSRYAVNLNIHNQHAQLHRLMTAHGIDYCVLKGSASAYYYPNPMLRTMGDVDFLVAPNMIAKVTEILKGEGFTPWEEEHICHIVLRKPGAHLEMHFEPAGMPDGKAGDLMRLYLANIFNEAETVEIDGISFTKPSDFHHGLILLMHTYHHLLSEGIGVRHLLDWSAFISSLDEDTFANLFEEKLKAIGLWQFAKILSSTTHIFLGAPYRKWMGKIDKKLCADLMEDILSGGNFGRKDATRQSSSLMISNAGKDGVRRSKLYYLWRTFHNSVGELYPICKKCGIFYLVFYPLRCIRYLFRILTGKRESLIKAIPQANQRRTLYGQLHIFEVEEHG